MSAGVSEARAAKAVRLLLEKAGAARDIALTVAENLADAEACTGGGTHKGHAPDNAANNMLSIYLDAARFTREDIYEREMAAFLDRLDVAPGTRSRQRRDESRRDGLILHPSVTGILRETAAKRSIEAKIAGILAYSAPRTA